ncbi:type II secretion system protein E [Candidatus Endobugula sertula]|uniref:Type II secretion system protein E n=1 Tax=Candidatus Endobugula sertula TaxID=62101 RepID=A0A1D2QSP3_9GAMM|nr:type II secretion system protein E [Candidatus Endobugula sertula]
MIAGTFIELHQCVNELLADGRLNQQDANLITSASRTREQAAMHPISYIASLKLHDRKSEGALLDEGTLSEWMSHVSQLPLFTIDPLKVNVSLITEVMSFAFAQRHHILCVEVNTHEMIVATSQPYISDWEEQLAHITRKPIKKVFANPTDIERYTVEFYSLSHSVFGASGIAGNRSFVTNFEQLLDLGSLKDPEANDQHVVNIVDWLLQYAFDQRASDIHIEPRREICKLRFRIDGVLHQVYELPISVAVAVISRLKILGRMNVAEKRKPQDGRIKTKGPDGNEIELRLSTLPTAFGEKMVLRIFDPDVLLRSFVELGLMDEDQARWNSMTAKSHGIILVTGPTGSGKTTTLYSSLKQLATPEVNVSTVEDPIEMIEESFNQTQVHSAIGLDFAAGVRTLLRQDPDIIMVGEIRDNETGQMAVQAALTGHLVLSTLHTNDAPTAITRLLDLGLPSFLIRSTVLGVMAQRLVRTLCPHCKAESDISQQEWDTLVAPWTAPKPDSICKPVGCLECRNTGYLGRQGIYEIMLMTDTLSQKINDRCDFMVLRKQAIKEGMRSLRLSGAQKIAAGITTVEEVLRVAPSTDEYRQALR